MAELKQDFPEGVDYRIVYDPTVFVRESISAVVETLVEALLLVVLVVVLFLRTWRASIIPLAAVPVSLVGTLAAMHLLGFSLNALSLFGLVLAIGIVVDDAIVVVENVERNIAKGLRPIDAAKQAMSEVTSPIIAISAVLIAVFVPTAFITGLSGQFYEQFALTIAISTVISAINSLTLSPALAALLLKPHGEAPDRFQRGIDFAFGWAIGPFNRFFEWLSVHYVGLTGKTLKRAGTATIAYVALVGVAWLGFKSVPEGFIPQQDKEYLVAFAQLPEAATLDRTEEVIRRMTDIMLAEPGVAHSVAFPGLSVNGFVNAPNVGIAFVALRDFEDPSFEKTRSANEIAAALNQKFAAIQDAYIAIFPPPPIQGLGTIGGFKLQIEDRADLGYQALYEETQKIVGAGWQTPGLDRCVLELPGQRAPGARRRRPRQGDGARRAAQRALRHDAGVSRLAVRQRLQSFRPHVSGQRASRHAVPPRARGHPPAQGAELAGRHGAARLVRVARAVGRSRPRHALQRLSVGRDQRQPGAGLLVRRSRGVDCGTCRQLAAERHARRVDRAHVSEAARRQRGNVGVPDLRAARVPRACGALREPDIAASRDPDRADDAACRRSRACGSSGGDNNIFTQIGLIVLVGLAAKNAILIVEFARAREQQGASIWEAIIDAARLRLRPILMTSIAFTAGVVPLVLASGAGAEMRNAMGVAVFAGMIGVTIFGLVLTPVFYWVVQRLAAGGRSRAERRSISDMTAVAAALIP